MKLSVLQWNVWFKETADNVVALVKEIDADIVCLQELTQDSTINPNRDIPADLEALGYASEYLPAHQRTGEKRIKMGNGIFTKYPIVNSRQIYVQHAEPNSESFSKENRVYVEATVKTGQQNLIVGTVHMSYTPRFEFDEAKVKETDQLFSAIQHNTERFIFMGDLNATPTSYTIEKLSKLLRPADPDYAQPTWTTKPFSHDGFEVDTLDWRLDYVFATPDVKVTDSRIIKTNYSDHLPILTTIEI